MKRVIAIALVGAVVLVAGGAAADTFAVRLVSETTGTITLGWDPQAGYGYLFSAAGTVVSRTNDPTRNTVKFSKGSEPYEVAVITKGAAGTYPPPAPPPPPAASLTQSIANGSTIPNVINWRAFYDVNNDGTEDDPGKIVFSVDGTSVLSEEQIPFGDSFADGTFVVADGTHTFTVQALSDADVGIVSNTVTATVQKPATPPPPPPTGGYPDASNTGTPAGTNLTAYTGPQNITTANTVIDGKLFTTCIEINAPGVVIRNSKISCATHYYAIRVTTGTVTVEDTDIDCRNTNNNGVGSSGVTLRRVDLSGCENGLNVSGNTTVEDSYIHDLTTANGAHTDGAQFNQGAANITFRHNTINPTNTTGATSCIIMWDEGNPQNSNVLLTNNLFLGSGTAFTIYTPRQGPLSNVRVTNNRFRKGVFGYNGGNGGLVTEWSGNVDDVTGNPV